MSNPIEFDFTLLDGKNVNGFADAYTSGDPSVGLFGPYYEEVWCEDENGNQITLSEPDEDKLFQKAAEIARDREYDPF